MPNPNVGFGGSTLVVPGAYSVIDATQMVPASRGLANVVALIGQATGGVPGVPQYFRNGDTARRVLRSGDLLDACGFAFDPAASPDVRGADLIVAIRINPATQSTLNILDGSSGVSVTLTSRDYGLWTTNIFAKVEAGSLTGKKITVQYADPQQGTIYEIFDNVVATQAAFVAAINSGIGSRPPSAYVTAAVGAGTIPANLTLTALAGGVEGTTTSTQWTNAFNALQVEEVQIVVPLTTDQTVAAQAAAHCDLMSGLKERSERIAFVGSSNVFATNALYITDLTTNAAALADSRTVLWAPGIKRPNASGVVTTYNPSFLAAAMAGLAAGQQVGETPTFKLIKAVGIDFGFTYSDLESLILAGVSAIQFVKNKGFRVAQCVTTYQSDANPMFREFSVRRVGDYLMRTLREDLEAGFVGGRQDQQTLNAMASRVGSVLTDMVADRVIVAFRNLAIAAVSSVVRVSFEFAPTEPINFVEITGYAKPASLAASFTGQDSFTGTSA